MITINPCVGSTNGALVADLNFEAIVQALAGYTHVQSFPSTIWFVEHNFGYQPSAVTIWINGLISSAYTSHVDNNTLELRFNAPMSGIAKCL